MDAHISLIVPVYNVEQYLPRCLASIQAQTIFDQTEVILVDDGSTDASGRICDEFAAQHANVRVLHKGNGGVSSARNAGLDAATGAFIGLSTATILSSRSALPAPTEPPCAPARMWSASALPASGATRR